MAKSAEFWIEDSQNCIIVGNNTNFCGKISLAITEGTRLQIGKNCLFSSDIVCRTGDSHTILDSDGKRLNPAKDIIIKDHVWIGHHVLINKGVVIMEDSVVGTGAVVTRGFEEKNIVIAGVPAKIVKRNISWNSKRQ